MAVNFSFFHIVYFGAITLNNSVKSVNLVLNCKYAVFTSTLCSDFILYANSKKFCSNEASGDASEQNERTAKFL